MPFSPTRGIATSCLKSALIFLSISFPSLLFAQEAGHYWVRPNGTYVVAEGHTIEEVCEFMITDADQLATCPDGTPKYGFGSVTQLDADSYQCNVEIIVERCPATIGTTPPATPIPINMSGPLYCPSPQAFRQTLFPPEVWQTVPEYVGNLNPKCDQYCPDGKTLVGPGGQCPEPPDQCDQRFGGPINCTNGRKYRREVNYMASGSFPLRIEWYYNSFANKNRTSHGLDDDAEYPTTGGPSLTLYSTQASTSTSGFKLYGATIPTDPQDLLTIYTGNAQRKWKNYYDRFLVASFEVGNIDPQDIPQVINLYRYDGDQEIYLYNNGVYEPQNAHKTKITRLDVSHSLAPGWEAVNEDNEREIYSLDGKLLKITASNGLSHTMTYDATNTALLSTVTDDFGHTLQFHYEDVGDPALITRITDPDGDDYRYTHTARGLLATIIYP